MQQMEEPRTPAQSTQLPELLGDPVDHVPISSDCPHQGADEPDAAFSVQLPPELGRTCSAAGAAALYELA
jgi:hypothetical protein